MLQFVFGYATVTLGEIAHYSNTRIDAQKLTADSYVGVDNLLPDRAGKTTSDYVPTTGKWAAYFKENILIGNIRPYLKKIWFATNDGGTNGDVLVIQCNEDITLPKFLYYVLASDRFFNYDNSYAKGAKMPRGDKELVMQYSFYIPSLERQAEIVSILDRFDALCNDLTSGLPAEIEARQKQYEYYRNRLLTFKE